MYTRPTVKKLLSVALFSLALAPVMYSQAQWESMVSTAKGSSVKPSEPQPLSYWTADPIKRDVSNDLCLGCRRNGQVVTANDFVTESHTANLGTISGYPIVQVFNRVIAKAAPPDTSDYHFPAGYRPSTEYKMLLVQVGPDQFREIFHLENEGQMQPLGDAHIVTAGSESVLSTVDRDSGNAGFCVDEYWTFDKSGPRRLNFDAVNTAIRQAVPANATFNARCSAINLERQQIGAAVQRFGAECKACSWMGSVTVDFVLRGSLVEPTEVQYTPFAADKNN